MLLLLVLCDIVVVVVSHADKIQIILYVYMCRLSFVCWLAIVVVVAAAVIRDIER